MSLEVHQTFTSFMEKVFWPAVRKGWLVTCFNSPFDLSRLSRDWRPSRKGGFSLIMSPAFGEKLNNGFDRNNVIRKLVRDVPVKRNAFNEFVRWLQQYKSQHQL